MKKLLYIILGLIALFLIVAAISPKTFQVERSVEVNQPSDRVFDYLVNLKSQDDFSVWAKKDPNMVNTYTGTDGTVGCINKWDSKDEEVGAGEQEIVNIVQGKQIDYALRFKRPREDNANASMIIDKAGADKSKVTWRFSGEMPFPMNVLLLTGMMEKNLGPALQTGMDNMKVIVDKFKDPVTVEMPEGGLIEEVLDAAKKATR